MNAWSEKDTKTVGRWLSVAGLVTIMPYWVTILISYYLGVVHTVGPFPIAMSGPAPYLFLTYSFHGVEVNFNLVYPFFSSAKLAMLLVTLFSLGLFGIVSWYAEFVGILKGVEGYEHFRDVRKAIDSLTHGSKEDKAMVAMCKTGITTVLAGMTLIYLYLVKLPLSLAVFPIAVSITVIAVLALHYSHRHFKRRLVQGRK